MDDRLAVSLVPALLPNDTLTHQQTQMAGDSSPAFLFLVAEWNILHDLIQER
jgi:hypothetical protein